MMATTVNYLEEYRKRYGGLNSHHDSQQLQRKATNIDHLLSRYLTPIVKTESIRDIKENNVEPVTQSDDKRQNVHCTINDTEDAESKSQHKQDNSNEQPSDNDSDDPFVDDLDMSLLATSNLTKRPSLTVSSILEKDEHLSLGTRHKTFRRSKSNPTEERQTQKLTTKHRFSNSFNSSERLVSIDDEELNTIILAELSNQQGVSKSNCDRRVIPVSRRSSCLSNISIESAQSRGSTSRQSGILELSDEDLDYEFGEQINGSLNDDSDSGITQLLFESDSLDAVEAISVTSEGTENCPRCHPIFTTRRSVSSLDNDVNMLCKKCSSLETERYQTIREILESERSYHKDLCLIQEQFVQALERTGLISRDEIRTIFGNLSQLIKVSNKFCSEIEHHVKVLAAQQDSSYNGAMIGQIICESSAMFLAFETYCLNFNTANSIIETLKKERELFNLFLDVSQKENMLLRRMDLKT